MSIDSQLKEMRELAKRENLNTVCESGESHPTKESSNRPMFNKMLNGITNGGYGAI